MSVCIQIELLYMNCLIVVAISTVQPPVSLMNKEFNWIGRSQLLKTTERSNVILQNAEQPPVDFHSQDEDPWTSNATQQHTWHNSCVELSISNHWIITAASHQLADKRIMCLDHSPQAVTSTLISEQPAVLVLPIKSRNPKLCLVSFLRINWSKLPRFYFSYSFQQWCFLPPLLMSWHHHFCETLKFWKMCTIMDCYDSSFAQMHVQQVHIAP